MMLQKLLHPWLLGVMGTSWRDFLHETHRKHEFPFRPFIIMRGSRSTFKEKEPMASQQEAVHRAHGPRPEEGDPSPSPSRFSIWTLEQVLAPLRASSENSIIVSAESMSPPPLVQNDKSWIIIALSKIILRQKQNPTEKVVQSQNVGPGSVFI